MWEQLTADEGEGECATWDCNNPPLVRFVSGGVGSNYCAPCARRIERMRAASEESNHQIDELAAAFAENPSIT